MKKPLNKVKVKLVGEDGNAFAILGRCQRAMRENDCTAEEIKTFMDDAKSGSYDHLLGVVCDTFKTS